VFVTDIGRSTLREKGGYCTVVPKVTVLCCTFNGEEHLEAQLASLAAQSMPNINVVASDDGSRDATRTILERWAGNWRKGSFTIVNGPGRGFAENFRSLLLLPLESDYFAFCDQDDLWDSDKMEHASAWLSRNASDVVGVYGSRTRLIDDDGRQIGLSPLFRTPPTFGNCLVQSFAGGNTIVFNRRAHALIREASQRTPFVSHDWWCYLLVTGAGGLAHYEPQPRIGYRQHGANLVGENGSLAGHLRRVKRAWGGQFARWNEANIAALQACADLLTPSALETLRAFAEARGGGPMFRLRELNRAGVYRQGTLGQATLYAAAFFGRI